MAKKSGRPPKSPSSAAKNNNSDRDLTSCSPTKDKDSLLDDEDLTDIDNLSPKQAALWLQKIDALREKIKEKVDVDAVDVNPSKPCGSGCNDDVRNPNSSPLLYLMPYLIPYQILFHKRITQEALDNVTIPSENIESAKEAIQSVLSAAIVPDQTVNGNMDVAVQETEKDAQQKSTSTGSWID
ncbi:hypothetical protein RIF29_28890 [Crotalaria pallida]|uniref:Uncharacterized protein n=1 Tax=Crotalaria pallida TaxID=3830 RepID=A0AAN9EIQ5_CROPI